LKIALDLAKLGESETFPNPMVGAVIALEAGEQASNAEVSQVWSSCQIIGKGFHQKFGEAHAEPNAIQDAIKTWQASTGLSSRFKTEKDLFGNCTIYVTLEPCAHFGKTVPCADLIIDKGFKGLVYASADPNPQVQGKGISKIKNAGVEVINLMNLKNELINQNMQIALNDASENKCELIEDTLQEINYLNRAFFKWIKTGSSWITLKIASTTDGRMTTGKDEPRWITNTNSRKSVHRLRSTHQAIITGIGTVLADDPLLTVRHSPEELGLAAIKQPQRIILKSSRDFTQEQRQNLQIFQPHENTATPLEYKISESSSDYDFSNLHDCIKHLSRLAYNKIMIEAGPKLASAFLEAELVDEIIHFEPITGSAESKLTEIIKRYQSGAFLGKAASISNSKIKSETICGDNKGNPDICLRINLQS
jgi:diaminohydroxyphosphoribosylaminopyrimidine deaminase/5-amino-6-(5-phosphoribosylamino)uracil reductase